VKHTEALLTQARQRFHEQLVDSGQIFITRKKVKGEMLETASVSDASQNTSRFLGISVAKAIGASELESSAPGQTQGANFEQCVRDFVRETLPQLGTLRPGNWTIECVGGSRTVDHLARYEPYRHLDDLANAIQQDPTLQAAIGNIYSVSPDVLVLRSPESDEVINSQGARVDGSAGRLSRIRRDNPQVEHDLVHAVISCKFTMRSDRAQNARTEALSLIRNRKGRTPHIMVVTAEPTPSRLSSLALGTGDIDTLYHMALPELQAAVDELGNDEARSMLEMLVQGQRIRDIADLPLDLCV